jgi:phosphoglycolate phosphatase-like HAD superfamily hydrolase
LQARFRRLRPVMHTGFEAIPLMRLIERGHPGEAELLARFPTHRDALLAREGLEPARLQALFGEIRDRLIAEDRAAWLRWNRFYPGLAQLLADAAARHPTYLITTKQERFAALLLEHHGVALPAERILGLERGRGKPQLLLALGEQPALAGGAFHFIEDRLETLRDVIATPGLEDVRLYLADWGYNTEAQRREAAALERVAVVSPEGFRARSGL